MIPSRYIVWVRLGEIDPAMQGEENHYVALDASDPAGQSVGIVP